MTKGEAINKVEAWLKRVNSPNDSESHVAYANPPVAAIERVIREAKANGK